MGKRDARPHRSGHLTDLDLPLCPVAGSAHFRYIGVLAA